MPIGTVKWYNPQKGFGFIQPDDGGKDAFVHVSAVERAGMTDLREGQKISFELVTDKRSGKASADKLKAVWTSPAFSHCVFTAAKGLDKQLGARFTRLMLEMDGKGPLTAEVMALEGCKKWVAGGPEGFVDLVKALQEERQPATRNK